MRVLITASGIQNYIFAINAQSAGARLRGRSARLGLVIDYCLDCLCNKYPGRFDVVRNAGSRLEVEFPEPPADLAAFLSELRTRLDRFSKDDLRGQVWFAVASGESTQSMHYALALGKLTQGRAPLQTPAAGASISWNESAFLLSPNPERHLDKEAARKLPESQFGLALVRPESRYLWFSTEPSATGHAVGIVDSFAVLEKTPPAQGLAWALDDDAASVAKIGRKRLARYAPPCGDRLCDFDEIANRSSGARFLGVLRADLDNLGSTFAKFHPDKEGQKGAKELSERLQFLFTEELEHLLTQPFPHCYVVYSGGDDLFLLGPWDQILRFIDVFQRKLKQSVARWGHPRLTLSAGFRLAHPKSPVRYLAEDVDAALEAAKAHTEGKDKPPHKDCISVFERVLRWDELHDGIEWADKLSVAVQGGMLSTGFLQRMQFYGNESRRFYEKHAIDGLRMVPLLQNDWSRNINQIGQTLRDELNRQVLPLLVQATEKGERMWCIMDFATRFTSYAVREGSSANGR